MSDLYPNSRFNNELRGHRTQALLTSRTITFVFRYPPIFIWNLLLVECFFIVRTMVLSARSTVAGGPDESNLLHLGPVHTVRALVGHALALPIPVLHETIFPLPVSLVLCPFFNTSLKKLSPIFILAPSCVSVPDEIQFDLPEIFRKLSPHRCNFISSCRFPAKRFHRNASQVFSPHHPL